MKTSKTLCKVICAIHLDAMTPEFKAANAELLKAIKMNDKSGAIPHADLEAINKAMKENDADKVGAALKKVQLQFSKAEKKLDDETKDVTARLAEAKKAAEKSKIDLKASKADAALFDKARKAADGIKANPRNASKLSPIADKLKKYGDLSKRVSQIVTLASSNKDVSKQAEMLKKAIDTAEKKYKKESANVEKEAKKAKDELDVLNMRVKVTQGKNDAFTKERLHIANVVKQMPQGDLRQKREGDGKLKEAERELIKIREEYDKNSQTIEQYREKLVSMAGEIYRDLTSNAEIYNNYIDLSKKTIWDARGRVSKLISVVNSWGMNRNERNKAQNAIIDAAYMVRKAYKYFEPSNFDKLKSEINNIKITLKGIGIGSSEVDFCFSGIDSLKDEANKALKAERSQIYGVSLENASREGYAPQRPWYWIEQNMSKTNEFIKYSEENKKHSKLREQLREAKNKYKELGGQIQPKQPTQGSVPEWMIK